MPKGSTFLLDAKEKNNICLNKIFNNYSQLSNTDGVKVYQPNSFELEERPKDIRDSSNSQWIWENHFSFHSSGRTLNIFNDKEWKKFLTLLNVYK